MLGFVLFRGALAVARQELDRAISDYNRKDSELTEQLRVSRMWLFLRVSVWTADDIKVG